VLKPEAEASFVADNVILVSRL